MAHVGAIPVHATPDMRRAAVHLAVVRHAAVDQDATTVVFCRTGGTAASGGWVRRVAAKGVVKRTGTIGKAIPHVPIPVIAAVAGQAVTIRLPVIKAARVMVPCRCNMATEKRSMANRM
jgi:hypothetical protein